MAEAQALIVPYLDGPYLVRGSVALQDQSGREIESDRAVIALCRCGKSRLRPFCDGSHHLVRFRAPSGRELRGADPAPGSTSAGSAEGAPSNIPSGPQHGRPDRAASARVDRGASALVQPALSTASRRTDSTPLRDDLAALEGEILALRERLLARAADTEQATARRRLACASELMAAACTAVHETQAAAGEKSR